MTGFWEDLRERIIANQQAKLDDAAYNERLDNIGKATTALLEAVSYTHLTLPTTPYV